MVVFSEILKLVEKAIRECPKEEKELHNDLLKIHEMVAEAKGELKQLEVGEGAPEIDKLVAKLDEIGRQVDISTPVPTSGEKVEGIEEILTPKRGVGTVLTDAVFQVYKELVAIAGAEKRYISLDELVEETGKSKSVLSHYMNRLKFFGYVEKKITDRKATFKPLVQ